jgi:hypothetical protein
MLLSSRALPFDVEFEDSEAEVSRVGARRPRGARASGVYPGKPGKPGKPGPGKPGKPSKPGRPPPRPQWPWPPRSWAGFLPVGHCPSCTCAGSTGSAPPPDAAEPAVDAAGVASADASHSDSELYAGGFGRLREIPFP